VSGGYWEQVAIMVAINAIVALGFYATFLTGQLSAAHAAFMGIGGYAAGTLTMKAGVPFLPAVLAGALLAALAAALLVSALKRLSGMFLAIATLAFAEILIVTLKNTRALGGALGLSGMPLATKFWHVAAALAILVVVFVRLENTRLGLGFRAVRDDAKAAAAAGIDVIRMRIVAFAVGGFLCGLGGALQVHYLGVMEPDELGFGVTVALLLYVVVGGRDYFLGPIVGAAIFTVLPELLRVSSRGRVFIFSLLLILVVILRPDGLIRRPVFWKWQRKGSDADGGAVHVADGT